MIKGVSHQLFQQFAKTAKQRLEQESPASGTSAAPADATSSDAATSAAVPAPVVEEEDVALSVLPLLFRTLVAGIVNFFRQIFGSGKS